METIQCPHCHKILPENAHYCIYCGEFFALVDAAQDMRAGQEVSASTGGNKKTRPLNGQNVYSSVWAGRRISSSLLDEDFGPEEEERVVEPRHVTWQKIVETPSRPPAIHPPRPPLPPQSHPILRHMPYGYRRLSPVILFWCSMIVLFFFVGGGIFGIMGTLGRERASSLSGATLQITPGDVAVGATVTLSGIGFSSRAQLGLTRDDAIPIPDTGGMTIISSRSNGSFTDTLVVGPDWGSGTHTISVEDAVTHKFTSSPIQVTGTGDVVRPAHFKISATSLDLGAGDQATNSVQKIALTNLGGGQITWKADASKPWLSISPQNGTFSSGMKTEVEIAVDRTNLLPGLFSDQINFSSSAGDSTLPIKMSVLALPPQKMPVLQLSPAALSFSGSDGGSAPATQGVSISNPGQGTLHWTAGTNVPWLALSAQSGTVNASDSQQVSVSVNTSNLLPGTYNGTITFKSDGTDGVTHNLQNIAISVTITPRCALNVAAPALSFTVSSQQSTLDAKVVSLSAANCSSSIAWLATSHASWLTISQTNGSTPARPAIQVNASGLKPGTYTSSVTFSSTSGTQEVPVKLTLSQPAMPALNVGSTDGLSFRSTNSQGDTKTQDILLTNTGSGTLLWSARATTGDSGSWLSLSSSSGSILAHQSTSLTVISKTLASMAPGTYSGVITITATDQQGNAIAGSPQRIPVSNVVRLRVTPSPTTPTSLPDPTSVPTVAPQPTSTPTARPTARPTPIPTPTPSPNPPTPTPGSRGIPPPVPTAIPSPNPTSIPTAAPTPVPTAKPIPTVAPTSIPTSEPIPVAVPTPVHTPNPTAIPTPVPTARHKPIAVPTPNDSTQQPLPTPAPTLAFKPCVAATPTYLFFTSNAQAGESELQSVTLNNCGSAGTVTVRSTGEWLTADGGGFVNAGESTIITVRATNVNQAGTYSGTITAAITTNNGRSARVTIGVTLKVKGNRPVSQPTQSSGEQAAPSPTPGDQPDPSQPPKRRARPTVPANAQ